MFQAVLIGVCESYLGALAVELGHGPTALAVLVTLPPLLGALAQLGVAPLVRWFGSRKRLVVAGAVMQALAALVLGVCVAFDVRALMPLLVAKTAFWVSGLVIGPAWGAWMATLTADGGRERYFAHRQAVVQLPLLASCMLSGFWLAQAASASETRNMLAVLCGVGAVFRLASAGLLSLQADMPPPDATAPAFFRNAARALRLTSWRPVFYVGALMMASNLAVPFFTPFALRDLGLSYATFASLIGTAMLAKAFASPLYHPLGERFGLMRLITVCGIGISIVPIVWAFSASVAVLFASQVLSGIAWGGVEFASYQLLLRAAPERLRLEFLSLAGSFIATAQVVGALFGSQLVEQVGVSYAELFAWSGILRALALLVLVRSVALRAGPLLRIVMRVVSLRPAGGSVSRPLVQLDDEPTPARESATTVGGTGG